MDEPNGNRVSADPTDEHSAVLTMLSSDAWQKRLEEARQARERLLAQRSVGVRRDPLIVNRIKTLAESGARNGPLSDVHASPEYEHGHDLDPDEEFPEFFPETEEDPQVPQPDVPVPHFIPPQRGWSHVPPLGPARPPEPAHVSAPLAAAPELAPVRRPMRIAAGFGLGLIAGIAMTSLLWALDVVDLKLARTQDRVAADPAGQPSIETRIQPIRMADDRQASVAVSAVATPPKAISTLPGVVGPPALPPDAPDLLTIAAFPGPAGIPPPVASAPPAKDTPGTIDLHPIRRPAAQVAMAVPPPPGAPDLFAAALPLPLVLPNAGGQAGLQMAQPADRAARPVDPAPPAPAASPATDVLVPHRINVMAPDSFDGTELSRTMNNLRQAGFTLGDSDRVSFTVKSSHVRFYHPADKTVAAALAAAVGGEARDFTGSDNAPPVGLIELWLKGSTPKIAAALPAKKKAKAPKPARAAPRQPAIAAEDPAIRALRDKIVRQLQKGEHL